MRSFDGDGSNRGMQRQRNLSHGSDARALESCKRGEDHLCGSEIRECKKGDLIFWIMAAL